MQMTPPSKAQTGGGRQRSGRGQCGRTGRGGGGGTRGGCNKGDRLVLYPQ